MASREVPTDWIAVMQDDTVENQPADTSRPMSPIEALMVALPGDEPETSQMELLALRDVLADAIDALSVRHKWVFEQHIIGRVSLQNLADWMGLSKSYVHIIKDEAIEQLQASLETNPVIAAYLNRYEDE